MLTGKTAWIKWWSAMLALEAVAIAGRVVEWRTAAAAFAASSVALGAPQTTRAVASAATRRRGPRARGSSAWLMYSDVGRQRSGVGKAIARPPNACSWNSACGYSRMSSGTPKKTRQQMRPLV